LSDLACRFLAFFRAAAVEVLGALLVASLALEAGPCPDGSEEPSQTVSPSASRVPPVQLRGTLEQSGPPLLSERAGCGRPVSAGGADWEPEGGQLELLKKGFRSQEPVREEKCRNVFFMLATQGGRRTRLQRNAGGSMSPGMPVGARPVAA
jgi:hypothetical protein